MIFAMGSVHSLRLLLGLWARHDSELLWLLAIAIELLTAFMIWRIVEIARIVTKSHQLKENRKFYGGLLVTLIVLLLPSLFSSIWANYVEFNGNPVLSVLWPGMAVACAILSGIPHAERVFKAEKQVEKEERAAKKLAKAARAVSDSLPAVSETDRTVSGISQALAGHLRAIQQALEDSWQTGDGRDKFTRVDVEKWQHVSKSHARNIVQYGLDHDLIEIISKLGHKHEYQFVGERT